MKTQRIIFYSPLSYQLLWADGANLCTYHEFCSAFDAAAANCRARDEALQLAISEQLATNRIPQFLCDHAPKEATK
jgi:hypothetical protein